MKPLVSTISCMLQTRKLFASPWVSFRQPVEKSAHNLTGISPNAAHAKQDAQCAVKFKQCAQNCHQRLALWVCPEIRSNPCAKLFIIFTIRQSLNPLRIPPPWLFQPSSQPIYCAFAAPFRAYLVAAPPSPQSHDALFGKFGRIS